MRKSFRHMRLESQVETNSLKVITKESHFETTESHFETTESHFDNPLSEDILSEDILSEDILSESASGASALSAPTSSLEQEDIGSSLDIDTIGSSRNSDTKSPAAGASGDSGDSYSREGIDITISLEEDRDRSVVPPSLSSLEEEDIGSSLNKKTEVPLEYSEEESRESQSETVEQRVRKRALEEAGYTSPRKAGDKQEQGKDERTNRKGLPVAPRYSSRSNRFTEPLSARMEKVFAENAPKIEELHERRRAEALLEKHYPKKPKAPVVKERCKKLGCWLWCEC